MRSSQTKRSSYLLIAIGLALVVVIAIVVLLMSRRRANNSPEAQAATTYMRSDLQALVDAQALSRRHTGVYSPDADRAGQLQSFGVDKPVVSLSGDGWFATVTSPRVPGVRCAVAIDAPNPLAASAKSGEIVCE